VADGTEYGVDVSVSLIFREGEASSKKSIMEDLQQQQRVPVDGTCRCLVWLQYVRKGTIDVVEMMTVSNERRKSPKVSQSNWCTGHQHVCEPTREKGNQLPSRTLYILLWPVESAPAGRIGGVLSLYNPAVWFTTVTFVMKSVAASANLGNQACYRKPEKSGDDGSDDCARWQLSSTRKGMVKMSIHCALLSCATSGFREQ
jgi:hypothetical protein